MKSYGALLLTGLLACGGCAGPECLPEPDGDTTPPEASLTVTYTAPATGERVSQTFTTQDPVQTLDAVAYGALEVTYAGSDPEGVRRVTLGTTFQLTTGIGVRQEAVATPPVIASCPQARLSGERTVPVGGKEGDLAVSASVENWAGQRAVTPRVVFRLRPPAS